MKGVAAALILALAMAHLIVGPSNAISCGDVDMCLLPCVSYLTGQRPTPAAACCDGVNKLKSMATTTPDRRYACNCMKQAASHFASISDDAVSNLPTACGTPLPFPISLKFDCSSIP
ncbi:non-specific lipid-transfer protein A-like [Typha latifolia]|uniref:non-specific lipid-transfer protein A-like n=1 Tax=Typha latifolia TaxID=4733 RepID=UPI003C2B9E50